MKREEIEQLLVDYANDSLSATDRRLLEAMFDTNPQLKEEAKEMADAMQALNSLEDYNAPKAEMDNKFYEMLQAAKNEYKPAKSREAVVIKMAWLKAAAVVAACIIAFIGGRYTVAPVEVIRYQKVMVKQPVPATPKAQYTASTVLPSVKKATPVLGHSKKEPEQDNSLLAVQLRSVFASERIDAIMGLAGKPKLTDAELKMLQLSLSEDPNANVRLTVLNTLRPVAKQQGVQQVLINSLNKQSDIMLQSTILDMLIDARSKQAIPQMIALLDDNSTNVIVQSKIRNGIESFLN